MVKILITSIIGAMGFLIHKFLIDHIIKQKAQLREMQSYLKSMANIIANPGNDMNNERNDIKNKLRDLSAELTAKTESISIYSLLALIKIVKDRSKINATCEDLIRLSNSLFEETKIQGFRNVDILKRVGKRLGISII